MNMQEKIAKFAIIAQKGEVKERKDEGGDSELLD